MIQANVRYSDVLSQRFGEAVQLDQTVHVVGEVLQRFPSLRPRQPVTGAAASPPMSLLWAPKTWSTPTRTDERWSRCLASRERSTACCGGLCEAARGRRQRDLLQRRRDLRRAMSAVRPYAQGRVVSIEDIVENLTVLRRRVAHLIAPHQLMPTVHVDMGLVAVMAPAVLLGPPRRDILLAPLCWLVLPSFRRLASLYPRVLFATVALFGHRHDRGIDDLAARRQIAQILQVAIERLE